MTDDCDHPYHDTFRAYADLLIDNIPIDRKMVRICENCKECIDVDNTGTQLFETPVPANSCDHPFEKVVDKEVSIRLTRNKDLEIKSFEVKYCEECEKYINEININLENSQVNPITEEA